MSAVLMFSSTKSVIYFLQVCKIDLIYFLISLLYILQYDSLRVPWFMLLGNHDYMGNPTAQIEFTHHRKNLFNLWRMPSNYYKVSLSGDNLADFFALDTNGCQNHVKRSHPETINCLKHQISWLDSELKSSTSPWKFVLGHHPMYNKGRGHASVAKCLREEKYTKVVQSYYGDCEEVQCEGYGLEKVISQHERIIYLSGHEHVFQQHWANGVQHVVCGNSGAEVRDGMGFYGGINDDVNVDWYDDTNSYGFVAVEVSENVVSIDFVNSQAEAFQSIKVPC